MTRPASDPDLYGFAPDACPVALLLIDVINDFEFPDGDAFLRRAAPAVDNIARLARQARQLKIPLIYVNDNFGRWRSDFKHLIEHAITNHTRGRDIVQRLRPTEEDYFVLKPKHSGFFCTTLELLLEHLEAHTLVLCGFAGNNCVLATATDAYMRGFKLIVPADCTACASDGEQQYALHHMSNVLKADTPTLNELSLATTLATARGRARPSKAPADRDNAGSSVSH